jgi:uncharacterized protein (TIGR02217 family)
MPRKWAPGHFLTISISSSRRGTYWKVDGAEPNLLTLPGIQGVQIRFKWSELETALGVYDFGTVAGSYADSVRSVRAELWRCQQAGSRFILMVVDKTFDGSNPAPSYMAGNPAYVRANQGGGYTMVRYNSYVQTRFRALLTALGAAFDSDPAWYAVAVQETAIGFSGATLSATGYSDVAYRDSLINNLKAASDAFPTSRVFWYTNFFPTPAQDYRLEEVADAIKTYNGGDHGIDMGGPDILPDKHELNTRVYPRFGNPPDGSFGELKLFNSMQFDSYAHIHTTNTPDARMPSDSWTAGSYWTMSQLFRWARDHINIESCMWEHDMGGAGYHFDPDAVAVIDTYSDFSVADSSGGELPPPDPEPVQPSDLIGSIFGEVTMFLETPRFPGCPSFGFTSEPVYSVSVVEMASGIERRNRNWSRPLHRYSATVGPRVQAEVQEALNYYHAVGGRAYGFRFKDATDYLSCAVGVTPTSIDQPIVFDETTAGYQLVKDNTVGVLTQRREIYKPVQNTILVADAGVLKTEGVDYTIDYSSGIVTFLYTPADDTLLTWGGEFDVPVRFDSEFPVEVQNYRIQSASFTLRELRHVA